MSHKIRCYTLFDITKTDIINRRAPLNGSTEQLLNWEQGRNTQCNFDTIIQVISLRSQPENISIPKKETFMFDENNMFGFLFEQEEGEYARWYFDFTVNYQGVFDDGVSKLGYLNDDCDSVPMIKVGTEWEKLPSFLDISPELKNIYFEEIANEKDE